MTRTAPVCPECADGHHTACIGHAIDPRTDRLVDCYCEPCRAAEQDDWEPWEPGP